MRKVFNHVSDESKGVRFCIIYSVNNTGRAEEGTGKKGSKPWLNLNFPEIKKIFVNDCVVLFTQTCYCYSGANW